MAKFRSRKFWMALISQVTGLVVLFAGAEHADTIEGASANIGALLLMALTGWGYIKAEGDIDRERAAGQAGQQQRMDNGQLHALAGLLVLGVMMAGCAATPTDRWYQARDTANVANKVYIAQANADELDDDELVRWGEALMTVHAQLEQAKALLPDGGMAFDSILDGVESYLAELAAQGDTDNGNRPGNSDGSSRSAPDSAGGRAMGQPAGEARRAAGRLHRRGSGSHRSGSRAHRQRGGADGARRETTPRCGHLTRAA